jgi:hypothetical protein
LYQRAISCGFEIFRKIRRYFQGFTCGFCTKELFPADLVFSGKFAGIPKDFLADFVFFFQIFFTNFLTFFKVTKLKLFIYKNQLNEN